MNASVGGDPFVLNTFCSSIYSNIESHRVYSAYIIDVLSSLRWLANLSVRSPSRVVKMPNGTCLNCYWDDSAQPRSESYREDIEAAENIAVSKRPDFFHNIRVACESGWDFSSRWLSDINDLSTIQTTNIIPEDLNCLLYKLEHLLSQFYLRPKNKDMSTKYADKAQKRSEAINLYL